MRWRFEEINREWLGGTRLAVPPEVVVEAFNRAERILGREWVQSSRENPGGVARGSAPTLHVISMGQRLAVLEGVAGAAGLIDRIRRGDQSAAAELTALYLLRSTRRAVDVELYPKVVAGESEREADFRIRQGSEPWTYVEVAQPDHSEAAERVRTVLNRVTGLVKAVKKPFALEVFLRREPTDPEVDLLSAKVPEVCQLEGVQREELPGGLGFLLLNPSEPGKIVLHQHPGEADHPRLSAAAVIVGPDEPHRHIAVRIAFADERAEAFLRTEARQLPKDFPGLIMVQMSGAPGGFKSWEPLLRRRFQPALHTRVSAVCLFSSGLVGTAEGEAWLPETKLLINLHAGLSIPSWIVDALTEAGAEYERVIGGGGA